MERLPNEGRGGRASDAAVVDLLRVKTSLGIGELTAALGVTATAVRQRLERLMRHGLVERRTLAGRRGRPAHAYSLTQAGRRSGGDNFRDLAVVLWRQVRGIRDVELRRGLIGRIGEALAARHRAEVSGTTPTERLREIVEIMRRRNIACGVESSPRGGLPVLASYSCPYPDLADEDRGICAAERAMLEELVGGPVRLAECRLDGDSCCRFEVTHRDGDGADAAGRRDLQTST